MSRENVELMRELWPAELDMVQLSVNGPSQEMVELLDPHLEVEFKSNQPGVPPLVYHGPEGLAAGWREWVLPFDSYLVEPRELFDAGDDVLVIVAVKARTHRDGVVMEHAPAVVCTVRDRKAVKLTFYLDVDEARAAAGLAG